MTDTISMTAARHAHRSLCRYLEKPREDRLFLLEDARDELGALLGPLLRTVEPAPTAGEPTREGFIKPVPREAARPRTTSLQDRIVAVLQKYDKPVRRDVLIREIGGKEKAIANSLTVLVRAGTVRRKRPSYYELASKAIPGHARTPEFLKGLQPGALPYQVARVLLRGGWWNAQGVAEVLGVDRILVACSLGRLYDKGILEKGDVRGYYRICEGAT